GMGFTRYGKKLFALDELSADELFEKLSDYLLHSGFADAWQDAEFDLDELRRAILEALETDQILPLEELEKLQAMEEGPRSSKLGEVIERLIQKMVDEGYLSVPDLDAVRGTPDEPRNAKFEITDKGLDFLGFKTLKQTLSKAGRGTFGRHDTNLLSTGVEA